VYIRYSKGIIGKTPTKIVPGKKHMGWWKNCWSICRKNDADI